MRRETLKKDSQTRIEDTKNLIDKKEDVVP